MKKIISLLIIIFCCCFFILTSYSNSKNPLTKDYQNTTDTIWNVKPIVKLNDPAPETGGSFLEFGKHYYLKSGVLVFWAKYGEDKKDWALYSLKDEKIRLVFRGNTDFTEPDGVKKKFSEDPPEFSFTTTRFIAKDNILYISFQKGLFDVINYGWDGEKFYKILGEGDKITVADYGELLINNSIFIPLVNKPGMKVLFGTQKPDKKEGSLLFDGKDFKKLFIEGEELPRTGGFRFKQILEGPHFFGDTMLVRLTVDNAPYKEAIFIITDKITEKIIAVGDPHPAFPDKKVADIREFYASGPFNLIIHTTADNKVPVYVDGCWLSYNHGKWKTIIESIKDFQLPKAYSGYKISQPLFINKNQDYVLLPASIASTQYINSTSGVSVNTSFSPYAVFMFDGNELTPLVKEVLKITTSSNIPPYVKPVPGMKGAIVKLSFLNEPKYFDYDLADPKLVPVPELKTDGNEKFLLSSIIAQRDGNRLIATTTRIVETKKTKETQVSGFFELTKAIQ